jgi:hypothetical protein
LHQRCLDQALLFVGDQLAPFHAHPHGFAGFGMGIDMGNFFLSGLAGL